MDLLIDYEIRRPELIERAQVVVALHRDGVQDVCRFIARDLVFAARDGAAGTIHLHVPRVLLAEGTYTVTVLIAQEGYYDREQVIFYSINPCVYACVSRVLEIVVGGGGLIARGTAVVGEADWSIAVQGSRTHRQEIRALSA
jgi:hypothetical protein